jgi:hypothetical protein
MTMRDWPLDWVFRDGTFPSGSGNWRREAKAAAEEWRIALGFEAIREGPSASGVIEVKGIPDTSWTFKPAASGVTHWADYTPDVPYEGCKAGDPGFGKTYWQNEGLLVAIHLDKFDWTDEMVFTTPDKSPTSKHIMAMKRTFAHEFGHVLGVGHYGLWPTLPTPPLTMVPVLGDERPSENYDHEPISNEYSAAVVERAQCLFYRR